MVYPNEVCHQLLAHESNLMTVFEMRGRRLYCLSQSEVYLLKTL